MKSEQKQWAVFRSSTILAHYFSPLMWALYATEILVIEVGKIGLIEFGDDTGYQVKIIDDSKNTGGFLIVTSKDLNDPTCEGFDAWVANKEDLQGYFKESNWVIKWL